MSKKILLSHGGGGEETQNLIKDLFFKHFDNEILLRMEDAASLVMNDHKMCICGDILKGRAKPFDCKVFGKACTPTNPMGSCMVSSEGACSAYFKYGKLNLKGARA